MSFVNLYNHSHYSILKGLPKPSEIVAKASELGMPGVGLVDLTNVHGVHEFYLSAKKAGINPIIGSEVFVVNSSLADAGRDELAHNLVLIAKTLKGYQNILSIITDSNLEGFDGKPRVDFDILRKYSDDIIVISGPIGSDISYQILCGETNEKIYEKIKLYQDIFGEENFYLQLLYHNDIPKQNFVTEKIIEIHKQYGVQVVAGNASYYIEKEDKTTQDVIMCLNTGHTMDNPDRPTMITGDYSFMTSEELEREFGHIPEALENTLKINNSVCVEFETGGVLIPKYDLPENDQKIYDEALELEKDEKGLKELSSDEWYLRYLCFEGLNWRYDYGIPKEEIFELVKKLDKPSLDKKLQETSPEELKDLSLTYYSDAKKTLLDGYSEDINKKIERLEYELVVVHEMGFDAYFLIVADYINYAREQGIPVGPGRGSAAGALLAFLSGITDIDPLPYDLLFERFLNPARVSMPDIDTDFSDDARDKVIEYCRNKYGSDHVAQICTFGTFAARAAVKDVGRVHGIDFQEMNKLAALIPEKPGTKLKGALEDSPEFKQAYDTNPKYKEIIDQALAIEGNVRQLGVHACAVIIAPEKMTNFTALQHPPKDTESIVTQYSAYPLEDLGLLKMDFLGLRNLTIIKRAQEIIKKNKGVDVDILGVNLEDPKVFEVFANGDTTGVFQFESDGMRKYLKELKPNCFEDIIVMVSLYRPGPLQYIPTYIDRKHGRENVEYPHESLEEILSPTQGIAVYQEQIMQMVQAFAGFSLGAADILRRAIGKKKIDVLMEQKNIFVKAAEELGHSKELALHIFEDVIEPFAGYGFNKSHAACYAFIAYQTAYLKAYYPTEFLASIMTSDEENMERVVLEVGEAKSKNIDVLPPNVNESLKHFTYIDDDTIRFGLKAIKGLGDGPIDAIIEGRNSGKYESLEDFVKRAGRDVINKRALESLILSGAMDDFGERGQMFANIEEITRFQKNFDKKSSSDQMGLFDLSGGEEEFDEGLKLTSFKEYSFEDKLAGEKEMLGFWVSGHPLDGLSNYLDRRSSNDATLKLSFDEIREKEDEEKEKILEEERKWEEEKKKSEAEGNKEDKKEEKKKPKKPKKEWKKDITKTGGVIYDMFKMMTKKGEPMMILKCQNFHSDFEVVIFPKKFDEYKDKVGIDKIIFAEGTLQANTEFERKSIMIDRLICGNISRIREDAKDMHLFDDRVFNAFLQTSNKDLKDKEEELKESEKEAVEEAIIPEEKPQKEEIKEYVIEILPTTSREVLVEMKKFLMSEEKGDIKIFIELKGQRKDTNISLKDISALEKWRKNNM